MLDTLRERIQEGEIVSQEEFAAILKANNVTIGQRLEIETYNTLGEHGFLHHIHFNTSNFGRQVDAKLLYTTITDEYNKAVPYSFITESMYTKRDKTLGNFVVGDSTLQKLCNAPQKR